MSGRESPVATPDGRPRGRWKFLSDYLQLVGSRYLGILVGAIRGLVIPGLLDPAAYGIYKTFLLIPPYVRSGHLGAVSGLSRQIPFYRGQGETDRLRLATKVAYTFSIGSAVLASVGIGAYALTLEDGAIRLALLIFVAFVIAEQQIAFRETHLLGHERFALAARLRLAQTLVTAALAIGGAWAGGLLGLIVGTSAGSLISFTAYRWVSRIGFPGLSLDRAMTRELLTIGAPMLVTGLLYNVFFTLDRLVIVRFLGAEAMGFYALAVTFVGYINDLSTLFSRIVFPKMVKQLGAGKSLDEVRRYVHMPMSGTSYLFPALIVFVHYFGIWLFRGFFPKYEPGAQALEILSFGILMYTHFLVYMNLVVAAKRQIGMMWIYPVATAVTLGLSLGAVNFGLGIEGVAAATVGGFFVLSVLQCVYTERRVLNSGDLGWRLLKSFGPTLLVVGLVLVDHAVFGDNGASFAGSLGRAGLVTTLYAPLLFVAWRRDPEFRGVLGMIRRGGGAL